MYRLIFWPQENFGGYPYQDVLKKAHDEAAQLLIVTLKKLGKNNQIKEFLEKKDASVKDAKEEDVKLRIF